MTTNTMTRRREDEKTPSTASTAPASCSQAFLVLICSFCLLFALLPSAEASVLIGEFDPAQGRSMNQPLAMDRWQGKSSAVQTIFVTFDQSEMSWLWPALEAIWGAHKIPLITWQPSYWSQNSPTDIEIRVARGDLDDYLTTWGLGLKNYIAGPDNVVGTADDRRAYMRFAHEMNGNWYPWSATKGQSTPADYIAMWRHVFNLFDSNEVGLPRSKVDNSLLWVWSPIDYDVGDFKMDQYYPGDDYVDWKGLTGFNWGTSENWSGWWDPVRLFSDSIDRIKKIGGSKPLAITEYSCLPNGGDKNQWIQQFFDMVLDKDVRMALYFNIDKTEQGGMKYWSVFGYGGDDEFWDAPTKTNWKGWSAYKDAMENSQMIGADLNNPRVLSDKLFLGGVSTAPAPSVQPSSPPADSSDDSDSDSGSASDSGSETPSPVPTPKVLSVFTDSTSGAYNFLSWGSNGTTTNQAFKVPASSSLFDDESAKSKVLKVHSTGWGGGGFFLGADEAAISLTGYRRLRFDVASTQRLRVEIEDMNGKKWNKFVKGTSSLAWRSVVLSTGSKSTTGSRIDFSKVKGLFLVTAEASTDFYIDNVRFEK